MAGVVLLTSQPLIPEPVQSRRRETYIHGGVWMKSIIIIAVLLVVIIVLVLVIKVI